MKITKLLPLSLVLAASFFFTGCATSLHHGPILPQATADKGALGVSQSAQNMQNRIGWGTFTVFAIPLAPVTVNGVADQELMNQIKDAVQQAGFKVQMVDSPAAAGNLPVLSCKVEKFSFRNYTWLFPLVFNWGTIKLDVSIAGPDGKVLWEKNYTGKGNGFYDFGTPVDHALTSILNELASDLQGVNLKN